MTHKHGCYWSGMTKHDDTVPNKLRKACLSDFTYNMLSFNDLFFSHCMICRLEPTALSSSMEPSRKQANSCLQPRTNNTECWPGKYSITMINSRMGFHSPVKALPVSSQVWSSVFIVSARKKSTVTFPSLIYCLPMILTSMADF